MIFYAATALMLAPIISYSNTTLNCKVLNNDKQVGQQNVQIQDSMLTSAWSQKNIEAYANSTFRATLCAQFGHGQKSGLRDVNQRYGKSHNVQRYHKTASYNDSCTLSCKQTTPSGRDATQNNSSIANSNLKRTEVAGRIGGFIAGS